MRRLSASAPVWWVLAASALLGACDSNKDRFPAISVNAGAYQTVHTGGTVLLSGSGTSGDGNALSYAWTQVSGPTASLSGAGQATASFFADPALLGGSDCVFLVFQLTATNSSGQSRSANTQVALVSGSSGSCLPSAVSLSGQVRYDRVPRTTGGALNRTGIYPAAARGVTVQAIDPGGSVLATGQTDDAGRYALVVPTPPSSLRVRALAQLKNSDPSWDVEVLDNTRQYALYALTGPMLNVPVAATANSTVSLVGDLYAASGVGDGNAYAELRAAGPFAIVDTLYGGLKSLATVAAFTSIPAFTVRWSTSNVAIDGDVAMGQVGGTYYRGSQREITLLGSATVETDEYDAPLVLHEFGHHFEVYISRSDSLGGAHFFGENTDMRLAFSEGMPTALGGMLSGETDYWDSYEPSAGFIYSIENISSIVGSYPGWHNEVSITYLLYDLFDAENEGPDSVSVTLGLPPIYDVLADEHKTGAPYNSIFSFIHALKTKQPTLASRIDGVVSVHNIAVIVDAYGSSETNSAGGGDTVLPVYTQLLAGGVSSSVNTVCISTAFGSYNKLANRRYFRFDAVSGGIYDIAITRTSGTLPAGTSSYLELRGIPAASCSVYAYSNICGQIGDGSFSFSSSSGGTHVMQLDEFRARDANSGSTCYRITAMRR